MLLYPYNGSLAQRGNLKKEKNTKQDWLHNERETELHVHVWKTDYNRNVNMVTAIYKLNLHGLVIPVNLTPSMYYVTKL